MSCLKVFYKKSFLKQYNKGGRVLRTELCVYTLTDPGYRAALYLTKLHQRLLSPTRDSLDRAVRPALVGSPHRLDRALVQLNANVDHLAELAGLRPAA